MSLEIELYSIDLIIYTFIISVFIALIIAVAAMCGFKQKDSEGGYSRL